MKVDQPAIDRLAAIAQNIPGWSPADQIFTLFTMVLMGAGTEGDVLELGSWCGRSSAALGLAAKLCGNTKILCVDLFPEKDDWHQNADGSYSMTVKLSGGVVRAYHHQTVWKEPFERDIAPLYVKHRGILEIFTQNIAQLRIDDVVLPYRGTLATFLAGAPPDRKYRLAFIDGDHGYDAVCADIQLVQKVLVPGGWICFDDAFTSYEGVDRAINELIVSNPEFDIGQQMTRKLFVARRRQSAGT
jgi:predicted O-methyltransferase YrrM